MFEIESFVQQRVIIKGLLNSKLLKRMVDIGVDKSLSNIALCEHRFLEKIKTLYKTAGNCDYQQQ